MMPSIPPGVPSPILQNGKLVGAITHVFVNDPTKGYGIFDERVSVFPIFRLPHEVQILVRTNDLAK